MRHGVRAAAAAGALWLAATLWLTLLPKGWIQVTPFWAFFVAVMAGADLVQNIVLFAPLGWIAHRAGWTAWRSVLAGLLISACIEWAQQWVPGRVTTAMDIACNTAGAALGWWMATPAVRPRARMAAAFAALAAFLGLHALNTQWPDAVDTVIGDGAWTGADRHICQPAASEQTACVSVSNTAQGGNRHVVIAGPAGRTYAHLWGVVSGRMMTREDCVLMKFEATRGAALHLRPPLMRACALADTTGLTVELRVDPRLERTMAGMWEPTRAGAWMWPVWPFESYRPALLRAVGALTFVIGTALLAGTVPWFLPVGYLLALSGLAFITGMRGPGLWEVGWAAVGWLIGVAMVRVDLWWQARPGASASSGRA